MWMKVPIGRHEHEDHDGWRVWKEGDTYWWFHYVPAYRRVTVAHSAGCEYNQRVGWMTHDSMDLSFVRMVDDADWEAMKKDPLPTIVEAVLCG